MAKEMEDFSRIGQASADTALKMWGDWTKSWQAMSAEFTDYTKRSVEDGAQTLEKLMSARSIEQVMEIQSSYARRCADDYMRQMSRMGSMYADLAKEGAKPFEKLMPTRR